MERRTRLVIAIAVLVTGAALAFADGAGGLAFGMVKPEWNPAFMPKAQMPLELEYMGGYGYGVGKQGNIVGGFGLAILDASLLSGEYSSGGNLAGGVGGMVMGWRLGGGTFLHVDMATRLGVGGMAVKSAGKWRGYAIVYAEPYAEVGVGLTPWMHLSATVGYQFMANFVPGKAFNDLLLRSPTLGFTVTWGKF